MEVDGPQDAHDDGMLAAPVIPRGEQVRLGCGVQGAGLQGKRTETRTQTDRRENVMPLASSY